MGWVYVIANEAVPKLVKVGCTDRDPDARAKELAATGVPGEYVVKFRLEVDDAFAVEREAHRLLHDMHHSKEWFCCTIERAREAVEKSAGFGSSGSPLVPGHPLESFFPQDHRRTSLPEFRFIVEPEQSRPAISDRPMFGEMNYTCSSCERVCRVQASKIVRCTYCGKSEVLN